MNEKKLIKFNLIMSCVILSIFVIMFVGVTIAYFTDTKQAATTLTAGNVKITLVQSAVKPDEYGNLVKDPEQRMLTVKRNMSQIPDEYKVYPGMSVYRDPTITNTGDDPEWIAAKVTLSTANGDLHKIMGYEDFEAVDIELLLSGGLLDEDIHFGDWNGIENVCHNDRYAMIQVPNRAEGEYIFYFLMLKPMAVGESVTLFDHVNFSEEWTNWQMQELSQLKIDIRAYGVQTSQLNGCLEAMTKAFPDHFPFDTGIK